MEPWTNEYIGLPYQFTGTTRDGCDCWGLARIILKEKYGKSLPDVLHDDSCPMRLSETVDASRGLVTKIAKPENGCLVLLKVFGFPSHIGVYVGDGFMLHTLGKQDSGLEQIARGKWKSRIEGFYNVN